MRHSKLMPEINTGSMADIAFLLLIFFLVTATISTDAGINRMLPSECPPGTDCTGEIAERNIIRIVVNNDNAIMVENELMPLSTLKASIKAFVNNNGDGSCYYCNGQQDKTLSDNPQKAIVSLQVGTQTSYETFIAVQNELSKAYYELRDAYCGNVLKKTSNTLTDAELQQVKKAYPFLISEVQTK
ncbi:MAG: ExbD/TolR family protein [Flavobacteriaceae bacterium]